MKKLLLGVVLSGLLAVPAFAADTFSLRGVSLGMHRQQVAKIETGTPTALEEAADMMLFYELGEPVFELSDARVYYYFTDPDIAQSLNFEEDRLYAMGIMSQVYELEDDRAVTDYKNVVGQLQATYGEPVFYGLMDDGKLDYVCNDENFAGMTQSFDGVLIGRAFWFAPDYNMCADLIATQNTMLYISAALSPMGSTWNELTLKE